jgi:hypothetical protein
MNFAFLFLLSTVPTESPTCQFTGENSKYGLGKANIEYVRELCTIIRQNESYTDVNWRVKYGLFTQKFQTEKKHK